MRLVDLKPYWIGHGGEGVSRGGQPVPRRDGVGVVLNCPCGDDREEHQLYVPFAQPLDGGPAVEGEKGWQRTGDTFDTLTLKPSILRRGNASCGWHGFITNGEVITL